MQRENKYLVFKYEDLRACMSGEDQQFLFDLIDKVTEYRKQKEKKPVNSYLVLNDDDPLTPIVWKLLELVVDLQNKEPNNEVHIP